MNNEDSELIRNINDSIKRYLEKHPGKLISKIIMKSNEIEDIILIDIEDVQNNNDNEKEKEKQVANLPHDSEILNEVQNVGGYANYSETSSIKSSFLGNRMNKHLKNSMQGGYYNKKQVFNLSHDSDFVHETNKVGGGNKKQQVTNLNSKCGSDTIASVTEIQMLKSQKGGNNNKVSNSEFMRKMKEFGVTSTSSDFCG